MKFNWSKFWSTFAAWFNVLWGVGMVVTANPLALFGIANFLVAGVLFYQLHTYSILKSWKVKE